jgi:hypothetical protein
MNIPIDELPGNKLRRAVFLETKLGVDMQVAAPRHHLVVKGRNAIGDLHDHASRGCPNSKRQI